MASTTFGQPIVCPACGGENDSHAVFCANPECRKALGEFRYAIEELGAKGKWHHTLARNCADFIGRPHFVGVHVMWFLLWIVLNSGLLAMSQRFDSYPFGLLALILSIETILITSILIISSRGQTALADKRAELDYEVNIQTYREIREIMRALEKISDRLDALERR